MEQPRRKRQKVAVACDPCRNRKVKCDGRAPVCEPCEKRTGDQAIACTWNTDPGRTVPPVPTGHVRWLEDRIKALEDATNSHLLRQKSDPPALNGESRKRLSVEAEPDQDAGVSSTGSGVQPHLKENVAQIERRASQGANVTRASAGISVRQSPVRAENTSPSDAHSVHAMVGASSDSDLREGFYGSASAAGFMQTVQKLVTKRLNNADISTQGYQDKTPLLIYGDTDAAQGRVECVLPTRRKADALMALYWKYIHPLYPYLMKSQMQKDYETIWTANASVAGERSFFCLLNIIFALASQIDSSIDIEHRAKAAAVFYLRARELIDVVETGSVRLVQSFLLLGQYFQSTNEPHPCWLFVGLAIRTAQSLGLHSPETSDAVIDKSTREVLRRVWHGCVLMDRMLSMIYGRPPMLGPKGSGSVPFPAPMDDEYLNLNHGQHLVFTERPSALDFYVQFLKLYEILHDVLFNFYHSGKPNNSQGPDVFDDYIGYSSKGQPSILELERRLLRWESNIPEYLKRGRVAAENDDGETVMRQAVVLHQWALHVRLLLLRRVLSSLITTDSQEIRSSTPTISSLSRRIFLQCSVVCVKVAQDAVETVDLWKAPKATDIGYLSAWWYNVLFLYTSATVLIAARLNTSILTEVSEDSILASWSRAVSLLEAYGIRSLAVQKLTTTLRLLYEAVPQQYSRLKLPVAQPEQPILHNREEPILNSGADPSWMTTVPFGFAGQNSWDDTLTQSNDAFIDFGESFDPNDVSWLMTIPFDV